jgi:hypothetical protein
VNWSALWATLALLCSPLPASAAIGLYTNPGVIWRADFEPGLPSLNGNCNLGSDGFCRAEIVRTDQIQMVANPVAQGRTAARYEVKWPDVYTDASGSTYSDSRTLMDPSLSAWEDEGNDRWYRWQVYLPLDYVSDYPKWDELQSSNATTTSRSGGGYNIEWHHEGNGSAPLYLTTGNEHFKLCLVDQAAQVCRIEMNLLPLVRGRWVDWVMHARWSSDPAIGFIELWADGQQVLQRYTAANMYPGYRSYWQIGLYRNGHIGDPSLRYTDGTPVYGSDGTPNALYYDGFVIGATQQAVMETSGGDDAGLVIDAGASLDAGVIDPFDAGSRADAGLADAGASDAGTRSVPSGAAGNPGSGNTSPSVKHGGCGVDADLTTSLLPLGLLLLAGVRRRR